MRRWRRQRVEELFRHPLFNLERHHLEAEELRKQALVVKAPDWVNIVPLLADGSVLLIRQWRYGIAAPCLEIPGGLVDDGEEPSETAARELLEETGYRAGKLGVLGRMHPNPAIMANTLTTWLATDLEPVDTERQIFGVEDEQISVEPTPLEAIPGLIQDGEITHALVIAAFYLLQTREVP
jgi:8-oxo-dGTP pyrophosphatase MutT (NUDIX family)